MVGRLASTTTIFRGVAPFVLADLVLVGLIIAFPALVLALPMALR